MANDAEADNFHCEIVIAVSSKHSSYHKYSFIFSLPLLFIFIFFCLFLYFKIYCSSAIDFSMCNYDNLWFLLFFIREPFLISPVAS